jgi:hypothetical protein
MPVGDRDWLLDGGTWVEEPDFYQDKFCRRNKEINLGDCLFPHIALPDVI